MGRELALVFFEPAGGNLVKRADRTSSGMHQQLLSLAELLQTIGGVAVPPDPDRSAADTELLYESLYQDLHIERFTCALEAGGPDVHSYSLDLGSPCRYCHVHGAEARAPDQNGPGKSLGAEWRFRP